MIKEPIKLNNTQYTHHHVKPMGYYKPRFAEDCGCKMSALPENPQVAMMYVPFQTDMSTFDEMTALKCGTLFPVLSKPFLGSGNR